MKRNIAVLCMFALALTSLPGSSSLSADELIKIGVAGPMTGGQSKMGNDVLNGVTLAVDEWNSKGGVLGKKIVVVKRDDEAKPPLAVTAARELVNEGVVGVVGHFNSSCTIPASEVYKEAGVVMVSPSATNPQVTDRKFWNVFRVCGRDDQQGEVAAEFVKNELKLKKVAILHDKTTYGQGLANEFQKGAKARGIEVVYYGGFPREELDFRAILTGVKAKNPELWFFGGIYDQAGPLVVQAREVGLRAPFMSGDGVIDQEFLKSAKENAEGSYLTFSKDPARIPLAREFLRKYKERFGEHGPYSIYAYDAANILLDGIAQAARSRASSTISRKTADAIRSKEHSAAIGNLRFDEKGDILGSYYVVWQVKNGTFVQYE